MYSKLHVQWHNTLEEVKSTSLISEALPLLAMNMRVCLAGAHRPKAEKPDPVVMSDHKSW
jgi:hypothetical protein